MTQIDREAWLSRREHSSAVATIKTMDTVVHSPAQTIGVTVGNAQVKSTKHHLANVCPSVAISVFEKNDFRWACNQHSTVPWTNGRGKTEVLREESAALGFAIMIF